MSRSAHEHAAARAAARAAELAARRTELASGRRATPDDVERAAHCAEQAQDRADQARERAAEAYRSAAQRRDQVANMHERLAETAAESLSQAEAHRTAADSTGRPLPRIAPGRKPPVEKAGTEPTESLWATTRQP